jgi:hypothetical protein
VASRRSLTLTDRADDLEAVQLRHVNVQEQQVEGLALQQGQRLPAVDGAQASMTTTSGRRRTNSLWSPGRVVSTVVKAAWLVAAR